MLVSSLPFNLSPKLVYSLVALVVSYVATRYGVELDPQLSEGLALLIGALVGYRVPAGAQIVTDVGAASDELLSEVARTELKL